MPPGESARAPIASPDYLSETERRPVAAWLRALRLHHWSKNLFVFVPLLLGHLYDDLAKVAASVAAFLLLGLLVSAGYLINDVADVEADRQHKSKRHRPFASGRISRRAGIAAAAMLAAVAFAGAALVARGLATVLIAYFLLTVGYSLWLKTVALVDVAAIATMLTLRIAAGGAAIGLARFYKTQKRYPEALEWYHQGQPIMAAAIEPTSNQKLLDEIAAVQRLAQP